MLCNVLYDGRSLLYHHHTSANVEGEGDEIRNHSSQFERSGSNWWMSTTVKVMNGRAKDDPEWSELGMYLRYQGIGVCHYLKGCVFAVQYFYWCSISRRWRQVLSEEIRHASVMPENDEVSSDFLIHFQTSPTSLPSEHRKTYQESMCYEPFHPS
jgi:hypothetical protein